MGTNEATPNSHEPLWTVHYCAPDRLNGQPHVSPWKNGPTGVISPPVKPLSPLLHLLFRSVLPFSLALISTSMLFLNFSYSHRGNISVLIISDPLHLKLVHFGGEDGYRDLQTPERLEDIKITIIKYNYQGCTDIWVCWTSQSLHQWRMILMPFGISSYSFCRIGSPSNVQVRSKVVHTRRYNYADVPEQLWTFSNYSKPQVQFRWLSKPPIQLCN